MDEAGIYARAIPEFDRAVQVGVAGGRVISVSFPRDSDSGARDDHDLLDRIEAYLRGEPDGFEDVTVALTVPTDRRRVLEHLRDVPYGETVTVESLARMTPRLDPGDADALDTVRAALAGDPAPLLIPDHRVTGGPGAAPADVTERLRAIEGIAGGERG
jgi:methylated-DNA-[protein]-cysteine S-methyltransferase